MDDALRSLARDFSADQRQELLSPAPDPDPLRTIADLRRENPRWSAEFASAVATQRELGQRARKAGSVPPGPWLLTRTGAEQSTRPAIAARRAAHLAAAGVATVVDLTAGLGVDAWACSQAGLNVVAIERDPLTADLCRANVPEATVLTADATTIDLADLPALPEPICWLVDPARRGSTLRADGSRALPERDPQRWSPPWSFIEHLRATHDWVAAKAPGAFTPTAQWSAEWVGVADYVAECAVYSGPHSPLAQHRQATLLSEDSSMSALTYPVTDERAPVGPLETFIGEPHPVFHRALPALCTGGVHRVSATSTWLTSPHASTPGVRWFAVLATGSAKQLREAARDAGIDAVAVKSQESKIPLSQWRSRIKLPDSNRYAMIVARGLDHAVLAERV
ncbi:MAG TPA: hypothetical protein VGP37_10890 [Candidatus Nanopelagicales bacterium]|nr:hypothetical protein [Candidatus Nanopelagicales bacterium]